MPKTMTEKQLAANRANAQKAGRKPGKLGPAMIAARRALKETLVERCRRNEEQHIRELERIALEGFSENARLTAINMLLDRGHGRAVQHSDMSVSGGVTFQVVTGVPEPDLELNVIEHDNDQVIGDSDETSDEWERRAAQVKNDDLHQSSHHKSQVGHMPTWPDSERKQK